MKGAQFTNCMNAYNYMYNKRIIGGV